MKGASAALLLAATLPEPGHPSIVPIGSALAGLVYAAFGRAAREPRDAVRDRLEDGAFYGGVIGLGMYGFGLATGLY